MTRYGWSSGTLPTVVGTTASEPSVGIPTAPSLRVSGAGNANYVRFDTAASKTVSARFYFRTPTEWSASSVNIMAMRPNASSLVLQIALAGMGSPGQLRLVKNGGGQMAVSSTNTMVVNSDYRIEVSYNGVSTSAAISVYPMQSDDALWTATVTDATLNLDVNRLDFGRINNTPTVPSDLFYDSIVIDDASVTSIGRDAADSVVVPEEPEEPSEDPSVYVWNSAEDPLLPILGSTITEVDTNTPNYIRVAQDSGQPAHLQWALPPGEESYSLRTYFRQTAWASSAFAILSLQPTLNTVTTTLTLGGSGQPGSARLTASGSTTLTQSSSNTLKLNRWYRGELQLNLTSGQARAAVFPVGNTSALWDSGWQSNALFSSPAPLYASIGRTTTTPVAPEFMLRSIKAQPGIDGWLGPVGKTTKQWHVWNGTELVPARLVGMWTGTTLQPIS